MKMVGGYLCLCTRPVESGGLRCNACERARVEALREKIDQEVLAFRRGQNGRAAIDRVLYNDGATGIDLTRTIVAIEAYDAQTVVSDDQELERLGEAVGVAFGLDTADRNNLETCRACVRPDVWLRNLVERFKLGLL